MRYETQKKSEIIVEIICPKVKTTDKLFLRENVSRKDLWRSMKFTSYFLEQKRIVRISILEKIVPYQQKLRCCDRNGTVCKLNSD